MLTETREINALISLIDDPDEEIHKHVKGKIKAYGKDAVYFLEQAWMEAGADAITRKRIEKIVHEINFEWVRKELSEWAENGSQCLLTGIILVARYNYPDISGSHIRRYLDRIKQDIWLELSPNLTAFEQIKVFNKIFFDLYKFRGNRKNYHSPQNSYINNVLETKKGNPLSLSIIYLIIARELDIPLHGINLPNHFVLGYVDEKLSRATGNNSSDLVFYVNPYNRGALLMNSDLEKFLKELNLPQKDEFMLPCTHREMILRNINNLIYAYRLKKDGEKVEELKELRDILAG